MLEWILTNTSNWHIIILLSVVVILFVRHIPGHTHTQQVYITDGNTQTLFTHTTVNNLSTLVTWVFMRSALLKSRFFCAIKTDSTWMCVPVGVCGWGRQGRLQEAVGGVWRWILSGGVCRSTSQSGRTLTHTMQKSEGERERDTAAAS